MHDPFLREMIYQSMSTLCISHCHCASKVVFTCEKEMEHIFCEHFREFAVTYAYTYTSIPVTLIYFFPDEGLIDKSPSLQGFYAHSQHSSDSSLATRNKSNLTVTDQSIKRYVMTCLGTNGIVIIWSFSSLSLTPNLTIYFSCYHNILTAVLTAG